MRSGNRLRSALALIATAAACGGGGQGPTAAPQGTLTADRPNVVLILTDDLDQRMGSIEVMPRLHERLTTQGASFSNAVVSLALCCPSRATILTGRYAHNTRIYRNLPPQGGFADFHQQGQETSTLATWLKAAGYRTGYVGKYLNGYPETASPTYVPPGWDDWASPISGTPYAGFAYVMNENGRLVSYGTSAGDYMTDVLSSEAVRFIQEADRRPFFLHLSTFAPHGPATPAPRHAGAFPDVSAPRPPSFDEADVGDKPSWLSVFRPLSGRDLRQIEELYRLRLQSLLAVDELIESVMKALESARALDNTYIVFTSDNGFHLGNHRLRAGKQTAFEEDLRVPLVIRGPGVARGLTLDHLVANTDLAPTIAEWAGARPSESPDGRSLVPLLRSTPPPTSAWRQALLLEHLQPVVDDDEEGGEGASALGVREPGTVEAAAGIPDFEGLRTTTLTYVAYATGELELYDLRSDPYQLNNLARTADAGLLARLAAHTVALRACAGPACTRLEDQLP